MANISEVERIPTDEEIFAWEPPQSYLGMPVSFYRAGHRQDNKPPELGFVVRPSSKSKKTIDIQVGREVFGNVRHLSDLKLRKAVGLRENGAWDFTSERVALYDRLDTLESKLDALARDDGGPPPAEVEGESLREKIAKLESTVHGLKIKVSKLANAAAKDSDHEGSE